MGGSDDDEDAGTGAGDYVKSLVFGGLDGIITTFAIVATVAGARAHPGLVLLMGAANLVADALSMGIGDYLSERAEDEFPDDQLVALCGITGGPSQAHQLA